MPQQNGMTIFASIANPLESRDVTTAKAVRRPPDFRNLFPRGENFLLLRIRLLQHWSLLLQ